MPASDTVHVDARGMKCPWPALRAARAMRSASRVSVEADDPIAAGELAALAREQGWSMESPGPHQFILIRTDGSA